MQIGEQFCMIIRAGRRRRYRLLLCADHLVPHHPWGHADEAE